MNCLVNEIFTDFGCIPNSPAGFVQKYYNVGLGVIGGIGFIGLIYGFFLIQTSQGDPIQIRKGKRYLTSSLTGILLVVFAVFYIKIIAVYILHIPGF
jgi:hypothetical protein